MIVVLDASAGIEIVLKRSQSIQLKEKISNSRKVFTTDLYKAEVTNVIGKYIKAQLITEEKGFDLLNLALALVDEYYDISQFTTESLHESIRLDHSAYDMFYFTLARRSGAILMTLDKKLMNIAKREGVEAFNPSSD
ncbi:MAG: type II toxin-antitoxin system VapC family toxin [Spirochaetaceae bacterium]|nr:type II toxin-antitoxin system VapC family toxin [Spirochaetaceae bacterium]